MKSLLSWIALPASLAMLFGGAEAAYSQTVVSTPLSGSVVVQGQSGGSQSSSCGSLPAVPHREVQVTQPFTTLRFQVSGAPSATLFVTGGNGQTHCVMADRYSGGTIEIPGLWNEGRYSVFVGEQGSGSHPFTLTIVQE